MAQTPLTQRDVFLRVVTSITDTDRLVVWAAADMAPSGILWGDFMALLPSGGSSLTVTFSTDGGSSYSATPTGSVTNIRFDDGTNPAVTVALSGTVQDSHLYVGPTAPASPTDGLLWSNTAVNQLEQWDTPTSAWILIGPTGSTPTPTPTTPGTINVTVGGPNIAVGGTTNPKLALLFRDPVDVFSGADLAEAQTARDAGLDATALAVFDADTLLAIMLRVGTTDIIEHRVSSAWQQIGGAGGGGGTGIPDGGTTAQALVKESATDGDAGWGDADAIAGFEAAVDARVAAAVLTVTTTTDTVTKIERRTWTGDLAFATALVFIASDPDPPPVDFTRVRMNFGRATDTTTAAYAGEWHELSRAQHDALTVAAIGDTVLQTTARLYRDFIDPTITNTAGITARDVYIGKDADLRLIVASANASEDAYPATVIYETETEVTVVTGVTVSAGGGTPTPTPTPADDTLYVAVSVNTAATEADFTAGTESDTLDVTVPTFTSPPSVYIYIGVDENADDITAIETGGIDIIGSWQELTARVDVGGVMLKIWRTVVVQNDLASGVVYTVTLG